MFQKSPPVLRPTNTKTTTPDPPAPTPVPKEMCWACWITEDPQSTVEEQEDGYINHNKYDELTKIMAWLNANPNYTMEIHAGGGQYKSKVYNSYEWTDDALNDFHARFARIQEMVRAAGGDPSRMKLKPGSMYGKTVWYNPGSIIK